MLKEDKVFGLKTRHLDLCNYFPTTLSNTLGDCGEQEDKVNNNKWSEEGRIRDGRKRMLEKEESMT